MTPTDATPRRSGGWRSSLWPAYAVVGFLAGFSAAVSTRSLTGVFFFVAFFWLFMTLGFAISVDARRARWQLAGPARWSHDRPLRSAVLAALAVAVVGAAGAVLWRAAVAGAVYGGVLGFSGLLLRHRRSELRAE